MEPKRVLAFTVVCHSGEAPATSIGAFVIDSSGAECARFAATYPGQKGETEPRDGEDICDSYDQLLSAFHAFFATWTRSSDVYVVTQALRPATARVLHDTWTAHPREGRREDLLAFDLATTLLARGHDPHDVGAYAAAHDIVGPADLAQGHLVDTAAAVAFCWRHLHLSPSTGRGPHRLAGRELDVDTVEGRMRVKVIDWYRRARGHRATAETESPYHEAVIRHTAAPGYHAGFEVLCTGPDGQPVVLGTRALHDAARR
jgi:hypothetical protein